MTFFHRLLKFLPILLIVLYTAILYKPFFLNGKLPIPADTTVGLYHPWRDFFADNFPNGIPFKNFIITDAVRQQYPWRQLAVENLSKAQLPLWNPYTFSGTPLLANLQSSPLYPLNIFLFLVKDFPLAWSILIILQTVLGGLFMAAYLRNLKLKDEAVAVGSIAWVGSGFFIAWLESNNLVQTAIWLPLLLLAVDRFFSDKHKSLWLLVHVGSLTASFLAGHLQVFFYVLVFDVAYVFLRTYQARKWRLFLVFLLSYLLSLIAILPQLLPTLNFISLSARTVDQANWSRPEWFIPWQNLVQFLTPDFFGNPATLNYTGVFSYQEFIGYVGLVPLLLALCAVVLRRGKETLFFTAVTVVAAVLALPTPLAKLPFILGLPFVSSAQPTRLLTIIDFALAALSALGLNQLLQSKSTLRERLVPVIIISATFLTLWLPMITSHQTGSVAARNLILPTFLLSLAWIIWLIGFNRKAVVLSLLLISLLDLTRFGGKFISFSQRDYLYPNTKTTLFLQKNTKVDHSRFMTLDDRIFPPNFEISYRLQSINGYDPLYLRRYGELLVSAQRNRPDVSQPWGFNRILIPKNFDSAITNFLGVRYILTLSDLQAPKLNLVFREGQTRVYENKDTFPRAFLVGKVVKAESQSDALKLVWQENLRLTAVVENANGPLPLGTGGEARIVDYQDNSVSIQTQSLGPSFLVLTDSYYPGWQVTVDAKPAMLYLTDYNYRGVAVPAGQHLVVFRYGQI